MSRNLVACITLPASPCHPKAGAVKVLDYHRMRGQGGPQWLPLSIPFSDLMPTSANDIKAVPTVPISSLALCLPPASLSHVLICPGSQDSPREGLRGQECSETPQHHFPKQPTSARQVTVPDSDPRALETPAPLPLCPCYYPAELSAQNGGPLLVPWDSGAGTACLLHRALPPQHRARLTQIN